jgi:hypothetical protein
VSPMNDYITTTFRVSQSVGLYIWIYSRRIDTGICTSGGRGSSPCLASCTHLGHSSITTTAPSSWIWLAAAGGPAGDLLSFWTYILVSFTFSFSPWFFHFLILSMVLSLPFHLRIHKFLHHRQHILINSFLHLRCSAWVFYFPFSLLDFSLLSWHVQGRMLFFLGGYLDQASLSHLSHIITSYLTPYTSAPPVAGQS